MKFSLPKFVIYLKHTGGSNNIGTASIFRFALIKRHVENSIRIFRLSVIGERGERGFTPRKFRLFPPLCDTGYNTARPIHRVSTPLGNKSHPWPSKSFTTVLITIVEEKQRLTTVETTEINKRYHRFLPINGFGELVFSFRFEKKWKRYSGGEDVYRRKRFFFLCTVSFPSN